VTTVRWLRLLKLNAILLAIVTLICAATIIVVVVRSSRVRRSGLVVGVVVGLRVLLVVVGAGARSPACAVEGLTTGLATTTSSEAAVGQG